MAGEFEDEYGVIIGDGVAEFEHPIHPIQAKVALKDKTEHEGDFVNRDLPFIIEIQVISLLSRSRVEAFCFRRESIRVSDQMTYGVFVALGFQKLLSLEI